MKKSSIALIVAAVILGGALIGTTVFGVLKIVEKRSDDDLPLATAYEETITPEPEETSPPFTAPEFTESLTEESTVANSTKAPANEGDYLSSLSAKEIELLNLFLSNFSEAYVENIDNTDVNAMINFVFLNTKINYSENLIDLDEAAQFQGYDHHYFEYMTEEYVHSRIKRFFGVEITPASTDWDIYYADGRYYIPDADGETYDHFSKVTDATVNADGTITVEYDVYVYDPEWGYDSPDNAVYKGIGSENITSICEYRYSGTAVLDPVYLGEDYANYHLISMKKN